jgi:hypothetical protein
MILFHLNKYNVLGSSENPNGNGRRWDSQYNSEGNIRLENSKA